MTWMSQSPQPVNLRPNRSLGGITIDVVIEEHHEDGLVITEHPVEQGVAVSDHAYRKPQTVVMRYGVSDSAGADSTDAGARRSQAIYEALLDLMAKREPFDIITGRRAYKNMLIEALSTVTERGQEASLIITIECREVIIVRTVATSIPPRARHANPNRTGGVSDTGAKQPQRRSALSAAFGDGGQTRSGGPA